ncbi:MAG: hypothetical protein HZA15_16340 [Nitrospirae bacterium]|nr:hypothetical protein [Nitrospirota bacterium]
MFMKCVRVIFCFLLCAAWGALHVSADDAEVPEVKAPKEETAAQKESRRMKGVFQEIMERNGTLKKSPEWLREAHSSLKIRDLRSIPKESYKDFGQFLYNGNVYFIVHPGYYAYFHAKHPLPQAEEIGGYPALNLVERLASDNTLGRDYNIMVMKEQERLIRNFLEFMSMEKKLVILVLPRNYRQHLLNGYADGRDEYARFINELTNMSPSILYIESETHDNGFLTRPDLELLQVFIDDTGAKKLMLGGGYLGKCLDNFYESVRLKYKYEDVSFVADITSVSPTDMVTDTVKLLVKGRINYRAMWKYFKKSGFSSPDPEEETIRIKRLPYYKIFQMQF